MKVLGNIIWLVLFLGFLDALFIFLLGGLLTLTVVGAPIGLGLMQLSKFLLMPFSKKMIEDEKAFDKGYHWFFAVIRILYIPFGFLFSVLIICQVIGLFVSLLGIPVAIVLSKSLSTIWNPVYKICVDEH